MNVAEIGAGCWIAAIGALVLMGRRWQTAKHRSKTNTDKTSRGNRNA